MDVMALPCLLLVLFLMNIDIVLMEIVEINSMEKVSSFIDYINAKHLIISGLPVS